MKRNNLQIGILAFVIACTVLYIYIYVIPKVSDVFVQTYTAEYGTLEIGEDAKYLVVRNERVYTSDNSGQVKRVALSGELKRKHSQAVVVGGTAYYTKDNGIISYCYDGLENKYTVDDIENITLSSIKSLGFGNNKNNLEKHEIQNCEENSATRGSKIFKVVDNKEWYTLCWVSKGKIEDFKEGHVVTVEFEDDTKLKMTIYKVAQQGKDLRIILSCNRYYDKFDEIRMGKCKIITLNKSGILLEADSIVQDGNRKIVYVVNKLGNTKAVPVNVLATDGKTSVVSKNYYSDSKGNRIETIECYKTILRVKQKEGDEIHVNQK